MYSFDYRNTCKFFFSLNFSAIVWMRSAFLSKVLLCISLPKFFRHMPQVEDLSIIFILFEISLLFVERGGPQHSGFSPFYMHYHVLEILLNNLLTNQPHFHQLNLHLLRNTINPPCVTISSCVGMKPR